MPRAKAKPTVTVLDGKTQLKQAQQEDAYDGPPLLSIIAQDAVAEEEQAEAQAQRPVSNQDLVEKAQELLELNEEVERLEAELKQVKDRREQVRKTEIPDLMKSLGMLNAAGKGSFTFGGGRIHLESKVYASCPKGNEESFFGWLRSHGAADMIREVVNAQTLSAFIRERRGDGLADPPGVSIHEEVVAKLTKSKS